TVPVDGISARNVTLLALGSGDADAELKLFGGTIDINPGVTVAAAIDMSSCGTCGGRSALVDISGDQLALNGDIFAGIESGTGFTRTQISLEANAGDVIVNGTVATQNLAQPGAIARVDLSAFGNVGMGTNGAIATRIINASTSTGDVNLNNFFAFQVLGNAAGSFNVTDTDFLSVGPITASNIRITTGGQLSVDNSLTASGGSLGAVDLTGSIITVNSRIDASSAVRLDGAGGVTISDDISVLRPSGVGVAAIAVLSNGNITLNSGATLSAVHSGSFGAAQVLLGGSGGVVNNITLGGNILASFNGAGSGGGQVGLIGSGVFQIDGQVQAFGGSGMIFMNSASSVQGNGLIEGGQIQAMTAGDVVLGNTKVTQLLLNASPGLVDVTNTGDLALFHFNNDTASQYSVDVTGNLVLPNNPSFTLLSSGDVSLTATGDLTVATNITAGSQALFDAGNSMSLGIPATPVTINANSILGLAGAGGTLLVNGTLSANTVYLQALNDLILGAGGGSGLVTLTANTSMVLAAFNSITSLVSPGFGQIDTGALSAYAGNRLDLTNIDLIVHNAVAPDVIDVTSVGDPGMIADLFTLGAIPTSTVDANLGLIAGNELVVDFLDFFGDYIYLKSDIVTLNNPVGTWLPGSEASPVVNPDVIVQLLPFDQARAIGIEALPPSSPLAGTTYFTNSGHFSRFPGTSIMAGGSLYGGSSTIGSNGIVNIGGQNFLLTTTGAVSGAGNIVSTGLIGIAGSAPPLFPPRPPPTTPPTGPVNTGVVNTVVQQTTSPTDPAGSTIPEETVQSNVPPEEQTGTETTVPPEEQPGTETTPEGPADPIAMLEQQPLIGGQVEVNNTVLTCQ
ncbi:MAG: hypothetical protein DRR03_10220, partial [Gammaproteobacteria bacterium]